MGSFDGVHKGHQAVLKRARLAAERGSFPFGAIVFRPHPRRFFRPLADPFRIMSNDARVAALEEFGVDVLFELSFDRDLSMKDDRAFARDVLAEGLGLNSVAVGFDYRFGRDRVGDAAGLERLGQELGFGVSIQPSVDEEGAKCSSTAIRAAIAEGDMKRAARLLSRPWVVDGVVERGDQRGRKIGFPTANISLGELIRPRFGVYATALRIDGEEVWRPAVANIGQRPTFEGDAELVEVHVFDFDADLYGRHVEVAVHDFIRPERKFDGLDALKAQISQDAAQARALLAAV